MKTLAQATWSQFSDQPVTFPVFKVKRRQDDVFSIEVQSVGQWLIVPVVEQEQKGFSHRVIGWTCVVRGDDPWTRIYECPTIFASQKKAKVWAETYRLYPLNLMVPILEDPRDYREES